MARPIKKKRPPHQAADRFYDYLMAHRSQVLRYAVAALVTGLLQFAASKLFGGVMWMFFARLGVLFLAGKYWVYKEKGTGFFYTARQLMVAMMVFVFLSLAINYLILFLGNKTFVGYVMLTVQEAAIFAIFQFLIFRKQD